MFDEELAQALDDLAVLGIKESDLDVVARFFGHLQHEAKADPDEVTALYAVTNLVALAAGKGGLLRTVLLNYPPFERKNEQ